MRALLLAALLAGLTGALGCQTLAVCDEACASACGGLISPRPDDGGTVRTARAEAAPGPGLAAMAF